MAAIASRLGRTAVSAALIACGTAIAASLGGAVVPPLDTINVFLPFWLAGLIMILLIVILLGPEGRTGYRRVRAAVALLVSVVLLGAFLLSPRAASQSIDATGKSYRLITFNMFKANPQPGRVVDWILAARADFVVLLELSKANRPILADLSHRFPFHYDCSGKGHCSTYILSRFPAERVWPLARGDADNRRALSAVTARFRMEGKPLAITAVHLDHPWPLGGQQAEIGPLADALAAVGRNGVIAGDFNSAPWTFALRRLAAAADVQLASGTTGTWPTDAPAAIFRLPFDQLYTGPCLGVRSVWRGPALGSDHFPMIADLVMETCHG